MKEVWLIWKKEWLNFWHDAVMRWIFLLVPIVALALLAGVYNSGVIFHIPTAIVDLDKSENSRMVIGQFEADENLDIIGYFSTFEEVKAAIENGEIKAGLVIPKDFGENIELRHSTRLLLIIDGTNMIYATNASTSMMQVAETLKATVGVKTLLAYRPTTDDDLYSSPGNLTDGADITLSDVTGTNSRTSSTGDLELDMNLYDAGYTMEEAKQVYMPITFQDEGWFNPTMNYAYFVLLGLFMNIWQQCCTLLFCMSSISETGSRYWVQIRSSGCSIWKYFSCKNLFQIALALLAALVILLISFYILELPTSVSLGTWMLFIACFTFSIHALAGMMSNLTSDSVDSTRLGMIVALPAFMISGFSWPLEMMGQTMQHIVRCVPQTWFFQGVNYLSFKSPTPAFIQHSCLMMLLLAGIFYTVSLLAFYFKERV